MEKCLLIVDDNEGVFESLEMNFQRDGWVCLWAADQRQAIGIAKDHNLSATIIDLSLGAESGLDVMERLLEIRPGLPIVFISGFGTLEAAVKAIKLGAYDFLPKPLNFKKLKQVLGEAIAAKLPGRAITLDSATTATGKMIAAPRGRIAALLTQAERVADSELPVLVSGESGSGKELLVEYIHDHSVRRAKPLVRVNCSSISETLAESELFGHVRGAFTGAGADRPGIFEQANGGAIHLDEIGDMSPANQARVLRVIEDKRIRRVGGSGEVSVNVRIIASTNKNLEELSRDGQFRLDLLYRLNAIELKVPPLRERPEDIPLLIEHFLDESAEGPGKRFSNKALEALACYQWTGNVRELRNVIKACVLLNPGDIVEIEHLPQAVRATPHCVGGKLEDAEREAISVALGEVGGNRKLAAKRLGISLRTLYYKLDRYGI